MSDIKWNNVLKDTIVASTGLIPVVGPVLKPLLGAFVGIIFPTEGPVYMDQVQDYVNHQLMAVIETIDAQNLYNDLMGLKDDFQTLPNKDRDFERFKDRIGNLESNTREIKRKFLNNSINPQNAVMYLVAFGTLRLAVMQEIYNDYNRLYGPQKPDDLKSNLEEYASEIHGEIHDYTNSIVQGRRKAIDARKQDLYVDHVPTGADWSRPPRGKEDPGSASPEYWVVRDRSDSSFAPRYSNLNDANLGLTCQRDHLEYDMDGFASKLDNLIDPFRYWRFMEPGATMFDPNEIFAYKRIGSFKSGYSIFDHKQLYLNHGPVTRIRTCWDGVNMGMEVFYGGVSAGFVGLNTNINTSDVTNTSGFSKYGGYFDDKVRYLHFGASLTASQVAAQFPKGDSFKIDFNPSNVKPNPDYQLAYVVGMANSGGIAQLSTVWVKKIDCDLGLGLNHAIGPNYIWPFDQMQPYLV